MELTQLLTLVGRMEGAAADRPFEHDQDITVFRRKDNRKWFAVHFRVPKRIFGGGEGGEFALNAKCDPTLARMLAQAYGGVVPAYHMNKTHWISVRLDGSVPPEEIENILNHAFTVAAPKAETKKGRNKKL